MHFIFRAALFFLAMIGSYIGSLKFQSPNPADFLTGGAIVVVCVIVLFIFTRSLWKFLGCFATLGLVIALVGGMVLLVSGGNMIENVTALFTNKDKAAEKTPSALPSQPVNPQTGLPQQSAQPVLQGSVSKILTGDRFVINGIPVRLYGIAAPVAGQNCTDAHNRAYDCGYISARKLQEIISSDSVSCKIMNQNSQGDLMAACSVSSFDLGAVMVEAGWAIALPNITPIYVPYEQKARQDKAGLWEGQFQAPWEWQAEQQQIQERASKITVPKVSLPTQKKKKSIFDSL